MKKSLIYSLFFLGIQLVTSSIVTIVFKLLKIGAPSTVLVISTLLSSAVTIFVFLWWRYSTVSPNYLRTKPVFVLLFCVFAALGTVIPSTWLQEQMPGLPDLIKEQMLGLIKSQYGFFIVGLLAPFVEELVFRGAVLRSLLQWCGNRKDWLGNHWAAIVLSALFFSIVHMNPAQMPHAFLIGLLLGWLYYRTGSIIPGIAVHWTNNAVAYILCNVLPNPDAKLIELLGTQNHVVLSIIYSLMLLLPSVYMLNKLMHK